MRTPVFFEARALGVSLGLGLIASLAAFLLPACSSSSSGDIGYAVRLNLMIDSSIPDSALGRIRSLELDVSGSAESWYQVIPVSGQLGGRKGTLIYRPRAVAGHLDFQLRARDDMSVQLGVGATSADLKPGATVDATVLISVPPISDFGVPGDLASSPDLALTPDLTTPKPPVDMATQAPPDLAKSSMDMSVIFDLTQLSDLAGEGG